jgi:hypothetical protein
MSKFIAAFRAAPTAANRVKLQKYLDKHMMALCMASEEEVAFLKTHEFSI